MTSTVDGQQIAVTGQPSSHGGYLIAGSCKSTRDGRNIGRSGDMHSCPIPDHGVTAVTASTTATCDGIRMLRVGDVAGCGAALTEN